MKLPPSFPDGTIFLDVQGLPVTAQYAQDRYLDWEDRDAEQPRPLTLDEIAGRGKAITEAQFRALVRRAHTCALPALLVRAAEDLQQRRRVCAELKAQGLSDPEISARMRPWRIRFRDDEAETIALRAIAAARRPARRA